MYPKNRFYLFPLQQSHPKSLIRLVIPSNAPLTPNMGQLKHTTLHSTRLKPSTSVGILSIFKPLLPQGYPNLVHKDYLKYSIWSMLNTASASFLSILSTQALLNALFSSSPSPSPSPSPSSSVPQTELTWLGSKGIVSAGINWILKDGFGQLGSIALVSMMSQHLDTNPRPLRFYSSLALTTACFIEFTLPYLSSQLHIIILASIANALKGTSWMITSATRAHFHQNLSSKANLGDITGKSASQSTIASIVGTSMAALAIPYLAFSRLNLILPAILISGASLLSIISAYLTSRFAPTNKLSINQLDRFVQAYLVDNNSWIKSPDSTCKTDSIFRFKSVSRLERLDNSFNLSFNPPLNESSNFSWITPPSNLDMSNFCIALDNGNHEICIWTLDGIKSHKLLEALLSALLLRRSFLSRPFSPEKVTEMIKVLKDSGWDVDNFIFHPLLHNQVELLIDQWNS